MSRQQRQKIDAMLRQPRPEGPPPSVEELRAGFAALMSTMIVPPGFRTSTTTLGGRSALSVPPEHGARPGGTILYFHGGGNVYGSPEAVLSLTAQLVVKTGFRAFSPDYRLAPEHPFPAGIQDTLSAYRALLDDGTDPSAIAFAGDSAGGGLTVTTCLATRDAGLPLPAAIVAFSPGLDATRTGESMDTKAGIDPILTRTGVERTGAMYLAGQDPRQPLLSPAVVADLTGFPPIQDAMNLGWKLAAVVQGRASDGLLDSYHAERHPVGVRLLTDTRAQTALITAFSPEGQALRGVLGELLARIPAMGAQLAAELSGLALAYPPADPSAHELTGRRVPDLPAGDTSVFALLTSARPVLLDFTGSAVVAHAARLAGDLGISVRAAGPWPGSEKVAAALVRPDGYCWWATEDPSDDQLLTALRTLGVGFPTWRTGSAGSSRSGPGHPTESATDAPPEPGEHTDTILDGLSTGRAAREWWLHQGVIA